MKIDDKPLVYSCSGCSNAAQMANHIAVKLDRSQQAEMSCIAGVGGNVKALVKVAKANRKIVVIDGCPLACAKACLTNLGIPPTLHIKLSDSGIKKQQHVDFDLEEAEYLYQGIATKIRNLG
ncbi:putative zinc-binding protein [Pedobacter arcticus]|uniref:putative zinc-binding protein n=1 Tax=Pedobacter arcticus TaxID=752140 RepID=UPI00037B5926|nr:putative zinc-binding protein [Pedobacter arcticus]